MVHSWATNGLGTEEGGGVHTRSRVLEEESLPVSSDSHESVWEVDGSSSEPTSNLDEILGNDRFGSTYFAELEVSESPSVGGSNNRLTGLDSISKITESVAVVVGKASSGEPHPKNNRLESTIC